MHEASLYAKLHYVISKAEEESMMSQGKLFSRSERPANAGRRAAGGWLRWAALILFLPAGLRAEISPTPVERALTEKTAVIRRNGPEDKGFDTHKALASWTEYPESRFTRGTAGIPGRKPTPDAISLSPDKRECIYWEDKRPSECANNSWLSTYPNDPFADYRVQQAEAVKRGELARVRAEARIIIKEHDDHMEKMESRWNDPKELPKTATRRLGIRLPTLQTDMIQAVSDELRATGRDPVITANPWVTHIIYKPLRKN